MLLRTRFTVRLALLKINPDNKGNYCIKYCVYDSKTKKPKYRNSDYWIDDKFWDEENKYVKKSYPDSRTINTKLNNKVEEIEKAIEDKIARKLPVNVDRILDGDYADDVFIDYFNEFIELRRRLTQKYSPGTIRNYEKERDRIKEYDPKITFSLIDHSWLGNYEAYLTESNLKKNTINAAWKILKAVYNQWRKDNFIKETPFDSYDNPKYQQTIRTYLLIEEVYQVEELLKQPLPDNIRVVINYFLLGCYSGLRLSDWQRFTYDGFVNNGSLLLGAKKNGEIISLPIHNRLQVILNNLKNMQPCYTEPEVNECLKAIAKLAKINKHITSHVGRHSFAIRCLELDFTEAMTAELMGISVREFTRSYKRITNRAIQKEMTKWNDAPAAEDPVIAELKKKIQERQNELSAPKEHDV